MLWWPESGVVVARIGRCGCPSRAWRLASHEEVVGFRDDWMAQLPDDGEYADGRFGIPVGNDLPPIPAPELPNARLRERR